MDVSGVVDESTEQEQGQEQEQEQEQESSGDECDVDLSLWGSDEEDIQDFQKEAMKYAVPETNPTSPANLLSPSPPLVLNTAAGATSSEVVSKKIREQFDEQLEVNTITVTL
jgi:hypothetical protein